jgi:predicted dehydrogenase
VRLAAVADPVPERCARAAPGVPRVASAADLIDARAADALVLATPAAAHLEDARLAADAGVPTLVEKPPAPTVLETAALAALDPAPWIGFNRRFEAGVSELREELRDVGPMELSLFLRTRRSSWHPYEAEDGVLLDLGPHLVDLAFWLSRGRPERVTGSARGQRVSIAIELAEDRGRARIECVDGRYRESVAVRAAGGTMRLERGGLRRGLWSLLGRSAESPLVPSLERQLEAFARAARGQPEPVLASAADGLVVMQTLAAAQASAETA